MCPVAETGLVPGLVSRRGRRHWALQRVPKWARNGTAIVVHLICLPDPGLKLRKSRSAGVVGMECLIGRGREHPGAAVSPRPVVEDVDPAEDLGPQLRACLPLPGVEKLCLHAMPKRLDDDVVEGVADGPERVRKAGGSHPQAEGSRRVLPGSRGRRNAAVRHSIGVAHREPRRVSSRRRVFVTAC